MRALPLFALCLAAPFAQADPLCTHMGGTQAYNHQSLCASSALAPQSGNSYYAASLQDDNPTTAWCEGVSGRGIGETLSFDWEYGGAFDRIVLINGYAKSESVWRKNGRIKDVTLRFWGVDDLRPRVATYRLSDTWSEQSIPNPWPRTQPRRFEIIIESTYPGSRWDDTCLSELWPDFGM